MVRFESLVPMTIGITAFHATMLPEGLVMAVPLLLLNLGLLADPVKVRAV